MQRVFSTAVSCRDGDGLDQCIRFKPASPFHRPRAACCREDNHRHDRACSPDTGERASCRQSAGQSATSAHPNRMRSIGPADPSCEIDNTFHRRISWILSPVMSGNEVFSKGPGDKSRPVPSERPERRCRMIHPLLRPHVREKLQQKRRSLTLRGRDRDLPAMQFHDSFTKGESKA